MDVKLVTYEEQYKQRVFDFTDSCFTELGKRFEPEGRHYFYNDIGREFEVFYCLVDNDMVIGTVALKKIDDSEVELKALYLHKDYRGKGLGSLLMSVSVNEAKTRGFKSIVLDSMLKYEDALRLYEKFGFEKIDRYNDNVMADVFMRMHL